MNLTEVRKAVGKIKTTLLKNSNSYAIGMLKSHFRGTGLQFKEHRVYTFGDDIRFIDWKILAKTNVPYIKTFEEERNVEIVVVIDASESMLSGYEGISKLQASIEICCLLYLLVKETGDYIHTTIISDDVTYIPKKRGETGVVALIASLQKKGILDANGKVDIEYNHNKTMTMDEKFTSILKHLAKRREIVILSDFNDFFDQKSLERVVFRSHVHCFQVLSPLDEADKVPYAIYSRNNYSSNKGMFSKIDLSGKRDLKTQFGKRFKKLNVAERYLESFIKEML